MDYLSYVLYLLLAWIAIHLLLSTAKNSNPSNSEKLPPGPFPLPIFGNLFSLGTKPHISLAQLAKIYGPLMYLKLGQVPTIVISSADIAKEALQKNDLSFSNRTVLDAVRPLNHHEKSVVWLPAGHQWRNLRKICSSHFFSTTRVEASQSLRRSKANDLISYVKQCSETGVAVDIGQAAFTTTMNLLSNTFFSADLCEPSSEFASEVKMIIRGIMEEAGKPNFADYFPFLSKIDPQGIRWRMNYHFERMIELFNTMINQQGLKGKNILASVQETTQDIGPSEMASLVPDLFTAGRETTTSTLEWAMAELINNPEKLNLSLITSSGNEIQSKNLTLFVFHTCKQ